MSFLMQFKINICCCCCFDHSQSRVEFFWSGFTGLALQLAILKVACTRVAKCQQSQGYVWLRKWTCKFAKNKQFFSGSKIWLERYDVWKIRHFATHVGSQNMQYPNVLPDMVPNITSERLKALRCLLDTMLDFMFHLIFSSNRSSYSVNVLL